MLPRSAQTAVRNGTFMAVVILCCIFAHISHGLQCYTCAYNKGDSNPCVDGPMELNRITNCNKTYCTIIRQETVKTREVISFSRGCEDKPLYYDNVIADYTHKFYYRTCKTDQCNNWDGINSNGNPSNNTVIPGKNSTSAIVRVSVTLLSVCLGLPTVMTGFY